MGTMKILVASLLALAWPAFAAGAADLVLSGCKVYPSPTARPLEGATIVVDRGKIESVRVGGTMQGKHEIDCKGRVVVAGFWNSHVHILTQDLMDGAHLPAARLSARLTEMFSRWGFTTVFDIASVLDNTLAIRRRVDSGEAEGPRILTVGDPFYPEGGTPIYVKDFLLRNHVASAEARSPGDATERAKRQLAKGADGVKIFAASFAAGGRIVAMPLDVAKAAVTAAHEAGKPAFAHPSNREGIDIALASGVDVLAHTAPLSGPWPPALIERMKAGHMALTPTLTLFEVEAKKFGESPEEAKAEMDTAIGQLRDFSKAGGRTLFGTDAGYTDVFDTTQEYRLMSRAGLDYRKLLASLTTNPAAQFRDTGRGEVAPGKIADLVVLEGDPSRDPAAFARVAFTIRAGKVVYSRAR
ncbi:MAG TPA: amidohydrolase family protein [Usitatibacter sp.]|jgi:imidazolonepropionase-like amidohydrolase|nr:amidohydrolase family protein [Usitatibacter sp.]